jgi:hypothetical protein
MKFSHFLAAAVMAVSTLACQSELVKKVDSDQGSNSGASAAKAPATTNQFLQGAPYFYQYNNTLNPGSTCQNTSMAMILKFYALQEGKTAVANGITPDGLTTKWGYQLAQSVFGFQSQFDQEAAALGLRVRDAAATETISLADFRNVAANAKNNSPLVVHGYFTGAGHILVVVGYDGNYYYCNDPAGKWNQVYKGGYNGQQTATSGYQVAYAKAKFEAAISPDGMVWMHGFAQ